MNYYKKVKSAFDDWATTYESDVVPKLDLRGSKNGAAFRKSKIITHTKWF